MAMVNDSESLVLTVPEAARICRCSAGTIYNGIKRGELPFGLRIGKRVIVSRKRLFEWLDGENHEDHNGHG